MNTTNPFEEYVQRVVMAEEAVKHARPLKQAERPMVSNPDKRVLLLSSESGAELITGIWPRRLLSSGWEVIVVPTKWPLAQAEQEALAIELAASSYEAGFRIVMTDPQLFSVWSSGRGEFIESVWGQMLETIAGIIGRERPKAVFMPHLDDVESRKWSTNALGNEALRRVAGAHDPLTVIETEVHKRMTILNTVVEGSVADVSAIVAAMSHLPGTSYLTILHRLMENVRLSSKLVGDTIGNRQMHFCARYRCTYWNKGTHRWPKVPRIIRIDDDPEKEIFPPPELF